MKFIGSSEYLSTRVSNALGGETELDLTLFNCPVTANGFLFNMYTAPGLGSEYEITLKHSLAPGAI